MRFLENNPNAKAPLAGCMINYHYYLGIKEAGKTTT